VRISWIKENPHLRWRDSGSDTRDPAEGERLGSGVDVTLNGEGTFPPIESLAAMMEQKLNHPVIIRLHIPPEKRVTYPAALVGLAANN
jgi:hypothetical protein